MISELKRNILPILYISAVLSGLMYLFNPPLLVFYAVCFVVLMTAFFALMIKLRKSGGLGGVAFLGIMVAVMIYSQIFLLSGADTRLDFVGWFFSGQSDSTVVPGYSTALALNAGIMLGGAAFYFTNVLYRPSFLFLLCLIPSAISSKNNSDYPIAFGGVIIALFLLICVQYRPRTGTITVSPKKLAGMGANAISLQNTEKKPFPLSAALTVGGMCMLLPFVLSFMTFEQQAPLKAVFDNAVMSASLGINGGGTGLPGFTNISADGGASNNMEQLLFTVSAEKPIYIRRQVFDLYDGSINSWRSLSDDNYNTGYGGWEKGKRKQRFSSFTDALKKYAEEYSKEFIACFGDEFYDTVTTRDVPFTRNLGSVITIGGYPTRIVFSTENTYAVHAVGDDENVYCTNKDEFFTEGNMAPDEVYSISYFDNTYDADILSAFSEDEFYERLGAFIYDSGIDKIVTSSEDFGYLISRYTDLLTARMYRDDYREESGGLQKTERSDEINALALSLTADKNSPLEKAQAIEDFFRNGNFVYNNELKASGVSVGDFLFDVKNGVCSDFASAMVVLAREAGLIARYTEGFAVSEKGEDGLYYVRAKHAHAFPEIYIPGYGWKIFEPTVAMVAGSAADAENTGLSTTAVYVIVIGSLLAAALLCLMVYLLRYRLAECVFRIRYAFTAKEGKLRLLFTRIQQLTRHTIEFYSTDEQENKRDSSSVTAEIAQQTVMKYARFDISEICEAFNRVTYGGQKDFDADRLYMVYKEMYRACQNALKKN